MLEASGGQYRESDPLAYGALVDQEIAQMDAFEHVIDLALQHHPHRPNTAALRFCTAFLTDRVRDAMQVERAELRGGYDLANGDLFRRARK